jgi:UDP-glucose 4-epimerase
MSNYLITGVAGFIGSHLVESLIEAGHNIIILDDLSTGSLDNLPDNDKIKFIHGTILDRKLLQSLFQNIDACFHLAAFASVQKSIDDWYHCHQVNFVGAMNVCHEAVKYDVPLIYASSAAIYGATLEMPLQENGPVNLISPYAVDKYAYELQVKVFGRLKNLRSCGLRFFNVYGARQRKDSDYSGVISVFKQQIQDNKALTIFGDGKQTRDFIHVSDVIRGMIASLNVVSTEALIINICTGNAYSINDLIDVISKIASIPEIQYLPKQCGDVVNSIGSTELAKTLLNFTCAISLQDGINQLFAKI